jgi:hypothetical protein
VTWLSQIYARGSRGDEREFLDRLDEAFLFVQTSIPRATSANA